MEIFKLIESTDNQVIIKVNAKSNLVIAQHPYLSSNYDYITVTRGDNHILTVIKKDGTTFSFHWGKGGHTLISDNSEELRLAVLDFIDKQGIVIECTFDKADRGTIYYNKNFGCWQLWLYKGSKSGYKYFKELKFNNNVGLNKVKKAAQNYGVCDFRQGTCATGIDIWYSHGNC